jgi:hypothetical protein
MTISSLPAKLLVSLLAASLLTGCATAIPPVEVTRFHRLPLATAPMMGSYRIDIAPGEGTSSASLATRDYGAAVARQLDRLGYRPAAGAEPDHIVVVTIDRTELSAGDNGGGVSVGVGGATGGYRSGVGVGVGLDLTRLFADRRAIVATRLSVRIARRGEELAVWEGRARTLAGTGTPAAQTGLDADKLATALFADFPGRSGETISVP